MALLALRPTWLIRFTKSPFSQKGKFVRSSGGKNKTAKETCLHGRMDARIYFGCCLGAASVLIAALRLNFE
jgi:hypothetical protein